MLARIYRPAKNAMQSGKVNTAWWELSFAPAAARVPDPLMGWTLTGDMNGQVRLRFATQQEAVDYAKRHGIPFEVAPELEKKALVKAYADNFAFHRREPWTH